MEIYFQSDPIVVGEQMLHIPISQMRGEYLFHPVLTTGEWLGQDENLGPDTQLNACPIHWFTGLLWGCLSGTVSRCHF